MEPPRIHLSEPVLIAALAVASAAGVAGCTSGHASSQRNCNPPSEALRARVTSVAVVPVPLKAVQIEEPTKKSTAFGGGAAGGALYGAGFALEAGFQTAGLGLLLGVVTVPIGAIVGGIGATVSAEDDAVIRALHEQILLSLKEAHPTESVAQQVARLVSTQSHLPAHLVSAAAADQIRPGETALYFDLARYGLRWDADSPAPGFRLTLSVRARLLDKPDGRALHELVWTRESEPKDFKAWAEGGPEPIRAELLRMQSEIANAATDELFTMVVIP
ncbi:MAG: hypothetical protein JSR77_11100 [Planctomycetes bacterium]|nr:hypothetical protein [Planctomycetota bacterium]